MEHARVKQQRDLIICPNVNCKNATCKLNKNKVCDYLQRNGSYTFHDGKIKVKRYMCNLLHETFSDKTFDDNTRCFHTLKPSLEEVYSDYLRGLTLLDISNKYGISISKVRTRIKRAKQINGDNGNSVDGS